MLTNTKTRAIIIAAIIILLLTGFVWIFFRKGGAPKSANQTRELKPVEIRQYKGKKLSSVSDFRENSIKGPQQIDKAKYRLRVTGLVNNPQTYTYDEVISGRQRYKKVVTLNCVEGWSVTILCEGILVRDLLEEAGVKGKAKVVIFYAHDGYSSAFPVEYFMKKDIIMAYKQNNTVLVPERGFPFQLVAEDKWGYKWVKWIEKIELSDNVKYKGYWEKRGYSDEGDLDKSFFDDR